MVESPAISPDPARRAPALVQHRAPRGPETSEIDDVDDEPEEVVTTTNDYRFGLVERFREV